MRSYTSFRKDRLAKNTTCVDEVNSFIHQISLRNNELNCFLSTDFDTALELAKVSDKNFDELCPRPLEGLVIAIKDNIAIKGQTVSCGSKLLKDFTSIYDATIVERLKANGAIIIGKTNMDEFAMGSSNENSAFGPVKHPINSEYVPGGSSGGSAVAVAAQMCHASLGSDTGGSIRQPAAFCGTFGYKPTYGAYSRFGLVAFASSLDQIGVFSHSAADIELMNSVVSGYDINDATSTVEPLVDFAPSNKAIAMLDDSLIGECSSEVLEKYRILESELINEGFRINKVTLPAIEAWISTYYILATAEASSNLARFDGVRYGYRSQANSNSMMESSRSEGFGPEVKRRIMLGTFVLSSGYYDAYYKKAQQVRRIISDAYDSIFKDNDLLLLPTTPTTAFKFGEKSSDPIAMYLSDLFTVSANIAGVPAINFPAGKNSNGMPIGLQAQYKKRFDKHLLSMAQKCSNFFAH